MIQKNLSLFGFLSTNSKEKKEKLQGLKNENKTIILYEAPHKLRGTLENIMEIFGNRNIVLARELTKIHEEFIRGNLVDILKDIDKIKGEFVILIEGSTKIDEQKEFLKSLTLEEHYMYYEKKSMDKKEIIKQIAKDRNINKNEIYKYFMKKE